MPTIDPAFSNLAYKSKGPSAAFRPAAKDSPIWEAAKDLEASFLSEMLKAAGVGKPSDTFGGGAGEEQFSSFLRDLQAKEMVNAGGIGLAETFFHAIKEKTHGK